MKTLYITILFLSLAYLTIGQPGTLDTTFGNQGKVISTGFTGQCYAAAIQTDGKIVCAGFGAPDTSNGFLLARYTTTGSMDASFGSNGKVITQLPGSHEEIDDIKIQSNGKIVAAGWTAYQNDSGIYRVDVAVARYTVSGSLDNTFGTNGVATTSIYGMKIYATCLSIQSDGKIVVAGNRNNDENDDSTAFVFRYTSSGILDTAFSNDGTLFETFDHPAQISTDS